MSEEQELNNLEEKIISNYNNETSVGVSALDPDFLFMLIFVAIPFDIVLGILAIFDFLFGISWVIGMVVSLIPFAFIGLWDYSRTSSLSRAHSDAKAKLDKGLEMINLQRQKTAAAKQAVTQAKSAAMKGTQATAKQTARQTAKIATRKIGTKIVLKRGAIALVGTSVPLVIGMIPWYVIWVLMTLKRN